jgi:hypothetical protein
MITHGYSVKEHDDPIVDVVEAAVSGFSECSEPGAFLVDLVPLRKSRFQRIAGDANYMPFFSRSHPTYTRNRYATLNPSSLHLTPRVFLSRTGMYDTHGTDSAIRACLVPWSGMENESKAVRGQVDRYGGCTSPIRKGSDGELVIVLKRLFSFSFLRSLSLPTGADTGVTDVRYCRPLEWPFRRSRLNCLAAGRSPPRLSIISSGQLLRYIQVRPTPLHLMITSCAHGARLLFACPISRAFRRSGHCRVIPSCFSVHNH